MITPGYFLAATIVECWRLLGRDGALDPLFAEAMSQALAVYLLRRYGGAPAARRGLELAPWQRRVAELVDARLEGGLHIAELAAAIGVSAGHFHRAFRPRRMSTSSTVRARSTSTAWSISAHR